MQRNAPTGRIDPATIRRAKLGDAHAFTVLVEAYYARCLRFAGSMLASPEDAEDVVQEVFVRVHAALARYQERQRFDSWLFRIVGNCCRSANASAHARLTQSLDAMLGATSLPAAAPPATAFSDEWGATVRRALAEVPEYNREILLLHYVEEFSYEEIEVMTGIKKSALKMRAKRAADQLRRALGTRENTYE
ncbi:MAG: RNA polymerase sigma factor [Gemmatimonadaceae bacterium]